MTIAIRRVPVEELIDLRRAVLRDGRDDLPATIAADPLPSTVHLGAFADDSPGAALIGCLTLVEEAFPAGEFECDARIALMGVAFTGQRRGVGRRLVAKAQELRPDGVWANARVTALGFYEACGFRAVGDEFAGPMSLPHRRILWP